MYVFFSRDDHGFSPLHWSCKDGHLKIVEMLLQRGARVNATNRGDDTPLHLASAHGHRDIVLLVCLDFTAKIYFHRFFYLKILALLPGSKRKYCKRCFA